MHYIPILKGKAAEYQALDDLEHDVKVGLTPLIELLPMKDGEEVDPWIDKVSERLEKAWKISRPIYVDIDAVGPVLASTGEHFLNRLIPLSVDRNINIVPVARLAMGDEHQSAIRRVLKDRESFGICLRLTGQDFESDFPSSAVSSHLRGLKIKEESVDLMLDFGALATDSAGPVAALMHSYLEVAPALARWRTVTIAATGFPNNLGRFGRDSVSRSSRTEWKSWLLLQKKSLRRRPQFSDYGIQHPELIDFDPKTMDVSAALRYTAEQEWVIVRGRGLKKNKGAQMHGLCAKLIELPEYKGPEFSKGDAWISNCAGRKVSYGNPGVWRRVGTGHHLTMVVRQLANLAAT